MAAAARLGAEGIVSNPVREGVCVDIEDWGPRGVATRHPSPFKRRPRPAGRQGL